MEPFSESIILIDDSGRTIKSYQNLNINLRFDTIINFMKEEF